MQLALYRAERPEVFEEIIGQKQIVKILQNQIRTGTVSQAYLFTGTRGTGKTTTARLLAKAVNCLNAEQNEAGGYENANGGVPCGCCDNCEAIREGKFVDVIELDAASNNGVDDIRAITDLVKYPPTIGRYKVFIIDEVHMLSQGAENAFLKTLEEPPEYAIFILATTDPQKVRQTIKSRCMQLNFKRVSEAELVEGMQKICMKKGVNASEDALITIASKADGSVRDALSILEQCMAAGEKNLDKNMVLEYTGSAGEDFYLAVTKEVQNGDLGKVLLYIDEIIKRGKDAKQILKDWLEHYRNLMVVKYVSRPERVVSASSENIARLKAQADAIDIKSIERAIRLISEYINIGRYSDRPRILLETVAVRLAGIGTGEESADASEIGTKAVVKKAVRASVGAAEKKYAPAMTKREVPAAANKDADLAEAEYSAGELADSYEAEAPANVASASVAVVDADDADDMWESIVAEMSRIERSFGSIVGRNSVAESFSNSELVIKVKKNKLGLAEANLSQLKDIARKLYGQDIVVTLKGGEILAIEQGFAPPINEAETDEVMSEDERVNELASDLGALLGQSVEVIDK
ncbi:MAG: DNA polymerase III subunit gamma/tau [Clostridiales bacterium]|nr:DNA polymerase III subunit gamma/tau [Candidatus Crickella caballi]